MKFKPVTSKYIFNSDELIRNFPSHLRMPIATWIKDVLKSAGVWSNNSFQAINLEFLNNLDLFFREGQPFPRDHNNFVSFVLDDPDRTINIIAICLQNYASPPQAQKMEHILSTGGSAYSVTFTSSNLESYQKGVADIVERVPEIVKESAIEILNTNNLVKEAWSSCYSLSPDYEKTVSRCVDALEGLFKIHYFPADSKPALVRFIKDFISNPGQLSFKGDTIINPKNLLTDLMKDFSSIRGQHTSGTGRAPSKEEAVFCLHFTIFIFHIHN